MPDQPVMTVPYRERVPAIRAKHKAFGFTGPTEQDRERDEVIGFLLNELQSQQFTLECRDRDERRHRNAALRASQYGTVGWMLAYALGACLASHVSGQGIAVAMASAFAAGTLGVALVYRIRKRDRLRSDAGHG